jgi:hypothetical protein
MSTLFFRSHLSRISYYARVNFCIRNALFFGRPRKSISYVLAKEGCAAQGIRKRYTEIGASGSESLRLGEKRAFSGWKPARIRNGSLIFWDCARYANLLSDQPHNIVQPILSKSGPNVFNKSFFPLVSYLSHYRLSPHGYVLSLLLFASLSIFLYYPSPPKSSPIERKLAV